ncbi:threonylcarbamoyl-AMP synthase [Siccirubricoccus deserti]|uniref:Threonylcarbamoyl-AMP synthase n=1 Tax=Siccirubricoccus deserti TaxID=2013562 RepID=A0A9X0UCE7_9PROT|nr:L-threonylcarbamoyladenylate synthase [Siccirubricoccus deserti]MBC4014366.1 threonylcarbamoyl-AMP synthase [Siccirubricoccus deserti]GGC33401.1 threonylcarbamoyl-AMP synthase [Siccirubricoccus deserti]
MTRLLPATAVAEAAALLRAGALVGFPTETVYGLGGDARNGRAVAGIFAAKGRPQFNPLISHFPDADAAFAEVVADDRAHALAAAFWPGPLTLVLPRRPDCRVDLLAGAGLDTLAVRVPSHPLALALLRAAAVPVAAPSANRSGQVSPTTAAHVLDGLGGRIAAVIDGGPCAVGVESTVLDLTGHGAVLLRPGGVAVEAIEALLGPVGRPLPLAAAEATRTLRSPGMLLSHYAPALPVRLGATTVAPDEALLAFGPPLPGAAVVWNLSERGELAEAAARLFAGLRWLDAEGGARGCTGIAAMLVPEVGLGAAINDRLTRAAAPRG